MSLQEIDSDSPCSHGTTRPCKLNFQLILPATLRGSKKGDRKISHKHRSSFNSGLVAHPLSALQGLQGFIIVRLLPDFRDLFRVSYLPLRINDDHHPAQ